MRDPPKGKSPEIEGPVKGNNGLRSLGLKNALPQCEQLPLSTGLKRRLKAPKRLTAFILFPFRKKIDNNVKSQQKICRKSQSSI
ncbi:MAG: hypothetical protein Q4A35_03525 [Candidatus Gracilibacteria bacterium]|nr:hypothetical protein [Candidatus Gracilibacteria bacterium]